jgi:hypothetical protein
MPFVRIEVAIDGPVATLGDVQRALTDLLGALDKTAPLDLCNLTLFATRFPDAESLPLGEASFGDNAQHIDMRLAVHSGTMDSTRKTTSKAKAIRGAGIALTGKERPGDNPLEVMP